MRVLVCLAALLIPAAAAAAEPRNALDIYVVDVEGGNATLFVTPSGELVLIDTGNTGDLAAKRDVVANYGSYSRCAPGPDRSSDPDPLSR